MTVADDVQVGSDEAVGDDEAGADARLLAVAAGLEDDDYGLGGRLGELLDRPRLRLGRLALLSSRNGVQGQQEHCGEEGGARHGMFPSRRAGVDVILTAGWCERQRDQDTVTLSPRSGIATSANPMVRNPSASAVARSGSP
jgi:hypothetical protein